MLAVCEAAMGAHPGRLVHDDLPVDGYGEDYEFWVDARAATRGDNYDSWIDHWVLGPRRRTHEYLEQSRAPSGSPRCGPRGVPTRGGTTWSSTHLTSRHRSTRGSSPRPSAPAISPDRVAALGADAVLAGAGVANLAAWLGVDLARAAGEDDVQLTAEIGLWGYEPTLGDPFVLNHRNFPSATMLGDAALVLQTLVGGPGTVTIGCLGGAQVDRYGNVNSTEIPGGPFLVGSGGGNDVASVAAEVVVVATLTPQRTPPECGYITSPGRAVRALVTDLGTAREARSATGSSSSGGAGPGVETAPLGWDLAVAADVERAPPPRDGSPPCAAGTRERSRRAARCHPPELFLHQETRSAAPLGSPGIGFIAVRLVRRVERPCGAGLWPGSCWKT